MPSVCTRLHGANACSPGLLMTGGRGTQGVMLLAHTSLCAATAFPQGANKGYWVCRKKMACSADTLTRGSHHAFRDFTDSVLNLKVRPGQSRRRAPPPPCSLCPLLPERVSVHARVCVIPVLVCHVHIAAFWGLCWPTAHLPSRCVAPAVVPSVWRAVRGGAAVRALHRHV